MRCRQGGGRIVELEGRAVVVTGAAGTAGSAVTGRLAAAGMVVRAMVRRPAEVPGAATVCTADLLDPEGLARAVAGAELAVHCAAALSHDWDENRAVNVQGTQNLVDALLGAGVRRLVHLSTISAYDLRAPQDLDEGSPLWTEELDAYGFTKAEAERRVLAARARGLETVILRPGVILSMHPKSYWGPRAVERARASEGALFPIPEMPYVHVDNLAEAVALAATCARADGEAYNVVDGVGSTEAYMETVYRRIGRAAPPLPDGVVAPRVAADKIRRDLGYDPPARWREFLHELGFVLEEPDSHRGEVEDGERGREEEDQLLADQAERDAKPLERARVAADFEEPEQAKEPDDPDCPSIDASQVEGGDREQVDQSAKAARRWRGRGELKRTGRAASRGRSSGATSRSEPAQ